MRSDVLEVHLKRIPGRAPVEVGLVESEELTPEQRFERRQRRSKQILAGLLLLGLVLFSSLKYVEIRLRSPIAVRTDRVTTNTVLDKGPIHLRAKEAAGPPGENPGSAAQTPAPSSSSAPSPSSKQVIKALTWLGKQSLDEYKLTYPPNDNAYYYYTRLLELDPNNQTAIRGILSIADHYSTLAEQAMARNEWQKTAAYVDIGLRIDPHNRSLLALQELARKQNPSLLATIKSLFSGK